MWKLLLVFVLCIVTGCASSPPKMTHEQMLNTWIGANTDKLVLKWGLPTRTYTLSDGRKVLEYYEERAQQTFSGMSVGKTAPTPSGYTTTGTITQQPSSGGGQTTYSYQAKTTVDQGVQFNNSVSPTYETSQVSCTTTFVADKNNTIVDWRYRGNDC